MPQSPVRAKGEVHVGSAIGYTMLPLQKYLDWCPCSPALFAGLQTLLNSVKQLSQNKTSLNGRVGFGRILTHSPSLLPFLGFFSSLPFVLQVAGCPS